ALAVGLRLVGGAVEAQAGAAADLLEFAFVEDVGRDPFRRRDAASFGFRPGCLDLPRDLALEIRPSLLADLALGAVSHELRERISFPLRRDLSLAFIGLRVLEAVTL